MKSQSFDLNPERPPQIEEFGLRRFDEDAPEYQNYCRASKDWLIASQLVGQGFPIRHSFKSIALSECPILWQESHGKISSKIGKGAIFALNGDRGLGKTQLATHIAQGLLKSRGDGKAFESKDVKYSVGIDLIRKIRSTWKKSTDESEHQAVRAFTEPRYLVIDEFSELRGDKEWDAPLFTNLIDRRYGANRDTIIIGNFKTSEISGVLGDSVASRMRECGGIIELKGESFRK